MFLFDVLLRNGYILIIYILISFYAKCLILVFLILFYILKTKIIVFFFFLFGLLYINDTSSEV